MTEHKKIVKKKRRISLSTLYRGVAVLFLLAVGSGILASVPYAKYATSSEEASGEARVVRLAMYAAPMTVQELQIDEKETSNRLNFVVYNDGIDESEMPDAELPDINQGESGSDDTSSAETATADESGDDSSGGSSDSDFDWNKYAEEYEKFRTSGVAQSYDVTVTLPREMPGVKITLLNNYTLLADEQRINNGTVFEGETSDNITYKFSKVGVMPAGVEVTDYIDLRFEADFSTCEFGKWEGI